LSTSHLAKDDHAFVEYWPNSFFVKDQETREILLQGKCVEGQYPMYSSSRLVHPSSTVAHQILQDNNISFSRSHKEYACDAYQTSKSHRLFPFFILNLCFLIYGVLPPPQLGGINIMPVLLMIKASSLGYISGK
jgi:hypothetical protein